jgi:hypothetical protein
MPPPVGTAPREPVFVSCIALGFACTLTAKRLSKMYSGIGNGGAYFQLYRILRGREWSKEMYQQGTLPEPAKALC